MAVRAASSASVLCRCARAGAFVCAAVRCRAAGRRQTANAYFEFLMARRLEGLGDQAGALAALERAAAADPMSAEVRAEIASFQLRRNRRTEAERRRSRRSSSTTAASKRIACSA